VLVLWVLVGHLRVLLDLWPVADAEEHLDVVTLALLLGARADVIGNLDPVA
jgi:hypothetical protein